MACYNANWHFLCQILVEIENRSEKMASRWNLHKNWRIRGAVTLNFIIKFA